MKAQKNYGNISILFNFLKFPIKIRQTEQKYKNKFGKYIDTNCNFKNIYEDLNFNKQKDLMQYQLHRCIVNFLLQKM